jgi:hypothetical protein
MYTERTAQFALETHVALCIRTRGLVRMGRVAPREDGVEPIVGSELMYQPVFRRSTSFRHAAPTHADAPPQTPAYPLSRAHDPSRVMLARVHSDDHEDRRPRVVLVAAGVGGWLAA